MTETVDYALADPSADSRADRLESGLNELASAAGRLTPLQQHWAGEQPAAVSNTTPTTKSGIVLIMRLFAVKIALCRV